MLYAYFIENYDSKDYEDNSPLFKKTIELNIPADNIFSDTEGTKAQFQEIINRLVDGDILVVRSLYDCGNNIGQLLRVIKYFNDKNVTIISVNEPYYRPTEMLLTLCAFDVAYKDRARKEGFTKAIADGRVGRPRNPRVRQAVKLYKSGKFTIDQICKISEVSTSSLYRELKRLDEETKDLEVIEKQVR